MTIEIPSPEAIEKMFTHDGVYKFARWSRPQAPAIFGVDDATLGQMKETIIKTVGFTGQEIADVDPDIGMNFMWFFCQSWDELKDAPGLAKLMPDLNERVDRLNAENAFTHRIYGFEEDGSIRMCASFFRMTGEMLDVPLNVLTMTETIRSLLLWSDNALDEHQSVFMIDESGSCHGHPVFTALLHAAYEPVMPATADDASHALRLHARITKLLEQPAE